jgi:hypothetical protein
MSKRSDRGGLSFSLSLGQGGPDEQNCETKRFPLCRSRGWHTDRYRSARRYNQHNCIARLGAEAAFTAGASHRPADHRPVAPAGLPGRYALRERILLSLEPPGCRTLACFRKGVTSAGEAWSWIKNQTTPPTRRRLFRRNLPQPLPKRHAG